MQDGMTGGECRDDFTANGRGSSGDVPMDADAWVSVGLRAIDVGRIVSSFVGGVSAHPAVSFIWKSWRFECRRFRRKPALSDENVSTFNV